MQALSDIPPELLAIAVKHAVASNPYFPKPAELRLSIQDEIADHQRRQAEARVRALPKPPEAPPPAPEDIAYVDRILAPVLASVRRKTGEMMHGSEGYRPTPEQLAASRKELGLDE